MTAPRHHTPRSDLPTHGWRAAKVAAAVGRPFMPWQRAAADVALEYDPDTGLYRYGVVVITVPRQAGKTDLEGSIATQHCLWTKRQFVRITMQDGKTADEWMREQHFPSLESTPIFKGRYRESRRAGAHGPHWIRTRSSFTTFPPKKGALDSKQSDKILVDEAWAHEEEEGRVLRQSIRPTMNTRRNAQLFVVSTLGTALSAYLDDYIARGKASLGDPNTRVAFIDYGLPDGADAEDLDVIAAHHPAYGHTLTMASLRDAMDDFRHPDTGVLDLAGWARMYGNRGSSVRELIFPDSVWTDAARIPVAVPDRVGLGLDVSPDGKHAAVAAGWRGTDPKSSEDDHGFVEILHTGDVDRALPALVARIATARRAPLYVDRQAQAALEVTDAFARLPEHERPEVVFLNRAQYGSSCVTLQRGIFNGTVHHFNDPDLDAAVQVAGKRDLEEGGIAWTRRGAAGSIAPLVAGTIALRGAELLEPVLAKPHIRGTRRAARV